MEKAADCTKQLRGNRPLLVTDKGIVEAGLAERVVRHLSGAGLIPAVFSEVEAEPSLENAEAAFALLKNSRCDSVIGLGGGSAIDVAKAVSLLAGSGGSLIDYIGVDLVPCRGLPLIAMPTNGGTGSEVTPIAVFTNPEARWKRGIVSRHILPDVAVVDPEMAVSGPPKMTAMSGMDALTHAIESYTSTRANPHTDMYAIEAVRLIATWLRKAFEDGSNLEARTGMAQGSLFAGVSLANAGVAAVHALAYPLGVNFGVPHGLANAILLPYVMRFNVNSAVGKYARVAQAFGAAMGHLTNLKEAEQAVSMVEELSAAVGIPRTLAGLGVAEADCDLMAPEAAGAARLISNNPAPVTERDAAIIYRQALFGTAW